MKLNSQCRKYLESVGLKAQADNDGAWRYLASLTGSEAEKARALAQGGTTTVAIESMPLENDSEDAQEIRAVAARYNMGEAWAAEQIAAGVTAQDAKDAVLAKLAVDKAPLRITVGEDNNLSSLIPAVEDSILLRGDPKRQLLGHDGKPRAAHPRASAFAVRNLAELGDRYLAAQGVNPSTLSGSDRKNLLMWGKPALGGAVAVHATGDFPAILASTYLKSALMEYNYTEPAWPAFCRRGVAQTFLAERVVNLSEFSSLSEVEEGDEYTQGTFSDRGEVKQVRKFAKFFDLTWEAMVNDRQLDMFAQIPRKMARAARRLENAIALSVLYTNGNMSDGHALFDATYHSNLATSTADKGAPTRLRLDAAELAMRSQLAGPDDSVLDIAPFSLIAPLALKSTCIQLLESENDPASSAIGVRNPWYQRLQLVTSPVLDNVGSVVQWFVCGDPNIYDVCELVLLAGFETPTLEIEDKMNADVRRYNLRHVVGAYARDWRAIYSNPGQ